jgi:hypothetical protein
MTSRHPFFRGHFFFCAALLFFPPQAQAEGANGPGSVGAIGSSPGRQVSGPAEEAASCYIVRRRVVDERGTLTIRREEVCELAENHLLPFSKTRFAISSGAAHSFS